MDHVRGIKRIDKTEIKCDGSLTLTLGLIATPHIYSDPAEIVLVLDRSSSMHSGKLDAMKQGALDLIHMISTATGGGGSTVERGTEIGLVSFNNEASADLPLSTDVAALSSIIQGYTASGSTNHLAAFTVAKSVFDFTSSKKKMVIFFTDGQTSSASGDPDPAVADLKASGVEIFCIGLNANETVLRNWASDPKEEHLALTASQEELDRLFHEIGSATIGIGAEDVILRDEIDPNFEIVSISVPAKGVARIIDKQNLEWTIPKLATESAETATMNVTLRHISTMEGVKAVNKKIFYLDKGGAEPVFADPHVTVTCGGGGLPVYPEPCPTATDFELNGCQDSRIVVLENTQLTGLGRVVQLNATLKNICPGKRVAMAVLLTEIAADGTEHSRGMKTMTIPAHEGPGCQDIEVKCIRFVLPEDLDVSGGSTTALCNARNFSARVMANYIDTDYVCCRDAGI